MSQRLFHRHFALMIAGQVISLFGNAILRFALSLFVLDLTGSAAIFGTILAVSMLPTILLSPVGGVLADRLPRQRIMVCLDFLTAAIVLVGGLAYVRAGSLIAITVLMLLLALIQAFYQPSVQASIPALTAPEHLAAANGVVLQVQALASLLGPILGGFLYGFWGIVPILTVSGLSFFLSAVMELFLRIPFTPQARTASPLRQIKQDLGEAVHFLTRENRRLFRLLLIIAGINLFLSALFIIGMPYLIKTHLGLSSQLYGFAEAAMGLGSIVGGLLSGLAAAKCGFRRSYLYLLGATLLLLPIVPILALQAPALATYGVLIGVVLLSMGCSALFSITAQTYVQKQTPDRLMGKVGAFIATICTCALPLGQALYGGLFEALKPVPWLVVLFGCAVSLVLVLATRKALQGVEE